MNNIQNDEPHNLLNFLVEKKRPNTPYHLISSRFNHIDDGILRLLLNELIDYKLISIEYGESTTYYTPTSAGRSIASKQGFTDYKLAQERIAQRNEDKSELEYQVLRQSKKLKPFEFWLLVLGSATGFIAFILTVIQFFTKD